MSTLDCGVPIGRRAWPLTDKHSVVPRDTLIRNCSEALCFALPKDDICKHAASFSSFDTTNPHNAMQDALFQTFIRAIELCIMTLRGKIDGQLQSSAFPIEMYLEVVFERREGLPDAEPDYDQEQKAIAARNLENTYGKQRASAAHLMSGARSTEGSSMYGSASTANIPFMNKYDDRVVKEYRFWVFIRESNLCLSTDIFNVFKHARDFAVDNFGVGTEYSTSRGAKGGGGGSGRMHVARGAATPTSVGQIVKDDEKYRLIVDEKKWLEAVYQYTHDPSLRDPKIVNLCLSAKEPLNNRNNPVNPLKVFSAEEMLRSAATSNILDPTQCRLENYYDGDAWFFPRPNLVLLVPYELMNVSRLRLMYTPDHQKMMIEPRLDRGETSTSSTVPPPPPVVRDDTEDEIDSGSRDPFIMSEDGAQAPDHEAARRRATSFSAPAVGARRDDDEDAGLDLSETGDDEESEAPGRQRRRQGADEDNDGDMGPPPPRRAGPSLHDTVPRDYNQLIHGDMTPVNISSAQFDAIGGSNKTHIHSLRTTYNHTTMWHVDNILDPTRRAREYTSMQFRATDEYAAKCMQACSNLSPPSCAINRWMLGAEKGQFGLMYTNVRRPYVDKEISLFGSQMVREIEKYETLLFTHTAHSEIYMARMSAMTAYWYVYNRLRLNLMLYGEKSTSKSYPIAMVVGLMIPGTTISLTNQSELADTHDGDDNDIVFSYEEMPPDLVIKATKRPDAQSQLKDSLTRGAISRRVITLASDGTRVTRTVVTERNCVILGAINKMEEEFEEAVKSRLVMRNHVKRERSDCSMQEKQSDATRKAREPAVKIAIQKFQHDFQFEQMVTAKIEHFITIGILLEPSRVVFSVVYPIYKKKLLDKFAIDIERRCGEQLDVFVRELIIHHAVFWLYHSPHSPHFGAKKFSIWHLLALNPMLKDTEEMVYHALDYFKESFIDPNQEAVVQCLREHVVPSLMGSVSQPDIYYAVDVVKKVATTTTATAPPPTDIAAQFQAQNAKKRPLNSMATDDPDESMATQNDDAAPVDDDVYGERITEAHDWNYFKIDRSFNKLVGLVVNAMKAKDMTRLLDVVQVRKILLALTHCKIESHRYKRNKIGATPTVVPDETSREIAFSAARLGAGSKVFYVHSSILNADNRDPHETAVESCMTMFTPTNKLVSGLPVSEGQPYILKVRRAKPTTFSPQVDELPDPKYETVSASLRNSMVEPLADGAELPALAPLSAGSRKVVLTTSYDDYATRYRLLQLAMRVTAMTVPRYIPRDADLDAIERHADMLQQPPVNYPDDVIRLSEERRRHIRAVASEIGRMGYAEIHKRKAACVGTDKQFDTIDHNDLENDDEDYGDNDAEREKRRRLADSFKRRNHAVVAQSINLPTPTPAPKPIAPAATNAHALKSFDAPLYNSSILINEDSNGPGYSGADADEIASRPTHFYDPVRALAEFNRRMNESGEY